MMPDLPQAPQIIYNHAKMGMYGELGEGANARIRFLQTVITRDDLDKITLISNIPGSETWDVRDLFQRDVDEERVSNQILPYLRNKHLVKYFNPVTLILLPLAANGFEVLKDIECIVPTIGEDGVRECYEKEGYYKFLIYDKDDPYGRIEWNDQRCFLVAIDGQHRVSALKRYRKDENDPLPNWNIPAIILNIYKVDPQGSSSSLIEIVRKAFVYINTKAERINIEREILLSDESINSICTQELIQYTHENDIKPLEHRNREIMPLFFFDWQGKVQAGSKVEGPASVKSIEEIRHWFEEYLLDKDGSDRQEIELQLDDLVPPIRANEVILKSEDTKRIRKQFRKVMLKGILYLLQNFTPYRSYISSCRTFEEDKIRQSDISGHAFKKLRFGSHNAPEDQSPAIIQEFLILTNRFELLKSQFPYLIQKDIGMRGVIFAFGECKKILEDIKGHSLDWEAYSILFTKQINKINSEKWFDNLDDLTDEKRKFLIYLVYDDSGSIINYKIEDSKNGLGSLLVILVSKKLMSEDEISDNDYIRIFDDFSNYLRKSYEKGFKKYHRATLRQLGDREWGIREFNAEVKRLAEDSASEIIEELEGFIIDNE